uniref:Uncharacterized protein n=1 Tax=Micrurus spixii TaxID=129469 RepID=A0A2D4LIQ6_9SAUR
MHSCKNGGSCKGFLGRKSGELIFFGGGVGACTILPLASHQTSQGGEIYKPLRPMQSLKSQNLELFLFSHPIPTLPTPQDLGEGKTEALLLLFFAHVCNTRTSYVNFASKRVGERDPDVGPALLASSRVQEGRKGKEKGKGQEIRGKEETEEKQEGKEEAGWVPSE